MALTAAEKELLAVVKYYNGQRDKKTIAKLVVKLDQEFGRDVAMTLTGFETKEIDGFYSVITPRKPRKKVEKAPAVTKVDEWDVDRRLAIHLNAESDLAQRVAHDMAAHIDTKMNPGDAWLSRKEAMEKFECKSATLTKANGILLSHNWIEEAEPGNFRKGYVVK